MLQEMAEEAGVDLDDVDEPESRSAPGMRRETIPSVSGPRAGRTASASSWNACAPSCPSTLRKIVNTYEIRSSEDQDAALAALSRLRDACELLARYRFFVAIKLQRAMGVGSKRGRSATKCWPATLAATRTVREACARMSREGGFRPLGDR